MKVLIKEINPPEEEMVQISCHEVDDEVLDIVQYVKSKEEILIGYEGNNIHQIPLQEVYYFESVENKVFSYLKDRVFEIKIKLYELEDKYSEQNFFRSSKSNILNLSKIAYVRPALNGRFTATLDNEEMIIISRQYVRDLKNKLQI